MGNAEYMGNLKLDTTTLTTSTTTSRQHGHDEKPLHPAFNNRHLDLDLGHLDWDHFGGTKCHKGNVKCVESVWFGKTYGPDKCILGRYGPWCASKVDGSKVYTNDGWNWFCEDC